MENEFVIEVSELTKNYGKKQVFDKFSMNINKDQIIGLIGANGSGKTTFFKMCVGVESFSKGSIRIFGGNPEKDMSVREKIVYSACALPVGKSEKLKDILKYYKIMYPYFDIEFATKLLDIYKINTKLTYKALSTGMKSMFHFTCALATRSPLTLLDEPFNGMDIENRKLSYEILLRDYCENPRTIIISSHNLEEMESILSEMILIDEGKLIFYKEMDEVRNLLLCVEGPKDKLDSLVNKLDADSIVKRASGTIGGDKLIVKKTEEISNTLKTFAENEGLSITPVSPENVCVFMTGHDNDDKLSELWS